MRKHMLIIAALAATVSACALEDQTLEDEALEDQTLEDQAQVVEGSRDEPGTTPAASSTPVCNGNGPPGSGWVLDSSYAAPSACRKCQEAGLRLEASGRWRTHCTLLGGIGPALLFRFCVACLNTEAAAGSPGDLADTATRASVE